MKYLIAVAIVISLLLMFSSTYVPVSSRYGSDIMHQWNVIGAFDNNTEAAQLLSKINGDMIKLMKHLRKKYQISYPDVLVDQEFRRTHADRHSLVKHLLNNYNFEVFYENDPGNLTGTTSYTVNKGERMHICLRDKANPHQLVPEQLMLFVILHEASHIAAYDSINHDERFWDVFAFILEEAVEIGIYVPVDYSKNPQVYCGIIVDYQPLGDRKRLR